MDPPEQAAEAKRVSLAIDASIRAEKAANKKKRVVRLLLLGQSESGKSTTLRQFQRLYSPNAFTQERVLWRAVIQLNIVRSLRTILDAIQPVVCSSYSPASSSSSSSFIVPDNNNNNPLAAHLSHLESILISHLFLQQDHHFQEPSIRLRPGWKDLFSNLASDEPQQILYSLRTDIIQLWHDPLVRDILRKRKIRLEETSGFFLDDIDRVTSLRYLPSDDDVLKARLKTVGVSEYIFEIDVGAGRDTGTEWRIVDVGGSRSQRPTWVPFFDDVDAIIFLAPISAFDQVLFEDRSVNRLEDSVLLWKAVCSSKLLAGVDLVLFLNKCDILEKKLQAGVRMSKYIRNYGDRSNDLDSVCKYLRGKFSAIHREYSPNPRKFYAFCTSVTDSTTTSGIIASVRDMVIRQHLKSSKLI